MAYRSALAKRGITAEVLLAGARRYAALVRAEGREVSKIAHPATWLNGERWADEIDPACRGNGRRGASLPTDPAAAFAELRDRADAQGAARFAGLTLLLDPQPPSDRTDPVAWERARRVEWLDLHKPEIEAALRRKAGRNGSS